MFGHSLICLALVCARERESEKKDGGAMRRRKAEKTPPQALQVNWLSPASCRTVLVLKDRLPFQSSQVGRTATDSSSTLRSVLPQAATARFHLVFLSSLHVTIYFQPA